MKKIFIISLVLLVIILIFLGVYNFAFKKDQIKNVSQQAEPLKSASTNNSGNSTALKIEKIFPITNQGVTGAVYDKKTDSVLYYSLQDGTSWKTDSDGKNKQPISDVKINGFKNAAWSPDRSKAIIAAVSEGKNIFYEYDVVTHKSLQLKDGLDTAIWDNMSSKIFYKYFNQSTKERTLNMADPDGSNWKKLTDINFRNLSVAQIPLTSLVSFWNSPSANEESILQSVGIAGEEPKTIFKGRFGVDYLWAPSGSLALVSSLNEKNGKKISLGTIDLNGNYTDLNVPTLVSKAVWSSDNKTVYYALAGGISEGTVLPDDYQNEKIVTKDTFWKMDVTTGKKERIVDPEEMSTSYDATNIFLSSIEDALYFVNKTDKKLYKIEL